MLCYDISANILLGFEIIHDNRFIYDHNDPECLLPIFDTTIISDKPEYTVNTTLCFKVYCPYCNKYFNTTIRDHLYSGYGCPTCPPKYQDGIINNYPGSRYRAAKTCEFRIRSATIHDNKYDYSSSYYTKSDENIFIICPTHGLFIKEARLHYKRGSGCRKCFFDKISRIRSNDTKYFIEQAEKVHGSKYDYSKSEYNGYHCDVEITCRKHGKFIQKAGVHMSGCGCQICSFENKFDIPFHPDRSQVVLYDKFYNQLLSTDRPTKGNFGELLVSCKKCDNRYAPSRRNVAHRIRSINAIGHGECNFYCSDKCRSECTIFYKKSYPRTSTESEHSARMRKARGCQHSSKYVLRQIQFDEFEYHFCERCGKHVDSPELHHTIEVAKDPEGSITPAGHMLVCEECHKEFTRLCL